MSQPIPFKLDPSRNPVLANLPEKATKGLMQSAEHLSVKGGAILVREGDVSDSIFFVTAGEVAILKGDVEIDRQTAGGVLGEMGVLTGQSRTASVKCITDVEVLRVSAKAFLAAVDDHPDTMRTLIRDLVRKFEGSQGVRVQQANKIQKAVDTLSRCVSPEVLHRILNQRTPEELLEGSLNEAAILFFDIKGFSSAAEQMSPQELLRALNEHLDIIIDSVARHEGTIVNFIGDAVLAIFNCPVPLDRPAIAALNCYLQCRYQMRELHGRHRDGGKTCFELGAGLNYGTVVSGAIGSESRFSYSVLGDEVNLAARLESLTRHYPAEVILSESCYQRLSPELAGQCVQIDRVQVKGRKTPVGLYTLDAMPAEEKRAFDAALQLYLKGDFLAARDAFGRIKGSLAAYLGRRCADLATRTSFAWPGYFSWEVK